MNGTHTYWHKFLAMGIHTHLQNILCACQFSLLGQSTVKGAPILHTIIYAYSNTRYIYTVQLQTTHSIVCYQCDGLINVNKENTETLSIHNSLMESQLRAIKVVSV